jgi:hypothetical protein
MSVFDDAIQPARQGRPVYGNCEPGGTVVVVGGADGDHAIVCGGWFAAELERRRARRKARVGGGQAAPCEEYEGGDVTGWDVLESLCDGAMGRGHADSFRISCSERTGGSVRAHITDPLAAGGANLGHVLREERRTALLPGGDLWDRLALPGAAMAPAYPPEAYEEAKYETDFGRLRALSEDASRFAASRGHDIPPAELPADIPPLPRVVAPSSDRRKLGGVEKAVAPRAAALEEYRALVGAQFEATARALGRK